ncbi:TasA family protein [Anaeromassilibacillus sp. D41t1_190614_C2]|uniref:TasA family protein n=1 Tax=Anaeromassilibacillus sp. D41t1_190614_C2 TaxID=2787078 RepID=UPI0018A0095E|nr:TasA family protein [Anaeromassilibacillus sp. D41t1_190614_C2]
MDKTKRHLVLSIVSFLLVLTLLGGTTFAWYMDAERVGSNFQAGVLDVDLTEGNTEEVVPLNFTNLRPLTIDQLRDAFQMDEDGVITNKNQEGFEGVPLYFYQVNVENKGTLPARVNLAIREQAKGSDPDLPYGHTIPNIVENGTGGVQVDEDEPEIACQNDLRGVLHIQLYRVAETADGYALQPIDNGAGDGDIDGTVTLWKDGKPSDYAVPEILKAGEKDSYIVAAWLPETVGNESQGQHFHAALYVNAGQVDEGASQAPLPGWSDSPSEGEGGEEGGETQVQATVKVYYETVDGTRTLVKEVDRAIEAAPGSVDLKPAASELEGTGYRPANMDETYTITLAEDGTVTYQGEDTAAAFTVEEDAYVDDTSKDFDSGDGTKENPFLIMNARQLDNVRKYMGSSTRGDFYYFEIGRNIDLTGYYGETWAEQGWTEDRGWMPIGWTPDSNTNCDEFWGNLDGQGYTITGLTIHNPTNVQTGLFGWVKGQTGHEDAGVIRNLKVEEPDVWGRMNGSTNSTLARV